MKSKEVSSLMPLFKYYVKSGQYFIARELTAQLQKENLKDVAYLLSCLEMWVQLNEYDEAKKIIDLLSAAKYPPDACHLCLQLVKFRLKRLLTVEEALDCAQVLLPAGKLAETEQVLQHALQLNPENLPAKVQLAKFYLDIGKLPLAITLADEITKTDASNSNAWAICGNAQRMLGNMPAAYDAHIKALSIDDENYESLLDVTAIDVNLACNDQDFEKSIKRSNQCLQVYIKKYLKVDDLQISIHKIKHDNEQAKYLLKNSGCLDYSNYIDLTDRLLNRFSASGPNVGIEVSSVELLLINDYNQNIFISDQGYSLGSCINENLDWKSIANQYLKSSPSLAVIDNFLNPDALNYLRNFCYESKVWHKTYQHAYLGAFVDKGFVSKVHLKISEELKIHLSDVIQQDRLEQLWAFKYDSILGKGINIHADFARINLNFWITPDDYHLNKQNGGLIVYTEPAPRDWNYFDYNINSEKIYEYLGRHNSKSVTVPYKANRAVLFDSTLFHETDEIKFEDSYLGRRVNMTYLFGTQLK